MITFIIFSNQAILLKQYQIKQSFFKLLFIKIIHIYLILIK